MGDGGACLLGIREGDLDLAQGDPVAVLHEGGLDAVPVHQDAVAALEVGDLVARGDAPEYAVVARNARVGHPQGVVELPTDVGFLVHDLELADACAFLDQQLGHQSLSDEMNE